MRRILAALTGLALLGAPGPMASPVEAAGSPFIDIAGTMIEADIASAPISGVDQRGLPRTPPCDIGAYELQP